MNYFGGMNILHLKIRLLKRMMARQKIIIKGLIQFKKKNLKFQMEKMKILKIRNIL